MQLSVKFNNEGYDSFIDFLKGICIICVVLTHSIPGEWQRMIGFPFWGAQAVPIFLLIQSYHYFKHDTLPKINWRKLFKRIVLPFAVVQALILAYIVVAYLCGSGVLKTPLKEFVYYGGRGPGSYYFWIYIQFALILLPLFGWVEKRVNIPIWLWGVVFALICELFELLCSYVHVSSEIYRLLPIRYLFLIYGGYVWAKSGVQFNFWTVALSIVSAFAIIMLQYRGMTFEPWIFDNCWRYFHWFCYCYAIWLLPSAAKVVNNIAGGGIRRLLHKAGKYSYQIFILQMLVFTIFPKDMNDWVYLIVTTVLSIAPVLGYYHIKEAYCTK